MSPTDKTIEGNEKATLTFGKTIKKADSAKNKNNPNIAIKGAKE